MKKFLAICLTLAMLLGCMTFVTVSAAGSDIMINNCDAYDGGTNDYMTGVKATRLVDTDDKTEGAGSWSSNHEGDLAVGSFQRRTITAPIDATAAKALCFDLYVADASKLNGIDRVTAGLPPAYSPTRLSVDYASGERLYFQTNGDPKVEWPRALLEIFLEPAGY